MKKLFVLVLALATATTASAANVSVETATGDWKDLPQLSQRGYEHLSEKVQAKLFEIAESKTCPSVALIQGRLEFRLGFAVLYEPGGSLTRILLPNLGCPAAEGVVGGAVLEMLQAGDFAPTGKSSTGWYQGTLGFSFAGKGAGGSVALATASQPGSVVGPNQNEVVCEKLEVIGTRLGADRVCMTRAQWAKRTQADRDAVEKAQLSPCVIMTTDSHGKPAC